MSGGSRKIVERRAPRRQRSGGDFNNASPADYNNIHPQQLIVNSCVEMLGAMPSLVFS